jgi:hypothetical protein
MEMCGVMFKFEARVVRILIYACFIGELARGCVI